MTTSPGRPQAVSVRRTLTRRKLFAAARELLPTRTRENRVKPLCEAAGFSRGAFYSNFSAFSDFLRQYIHGEFAQVSRQLSQVQALIKASLPPEDNPSTGFFLTSHWSRVAAAISETMLFEREFVLVLTELRVYAARNREFFSDSTPRNNSH